MQQKILAVGLVVVSSATASMAAAGAITVASPDGRSVVTLDSEKLTYAVSRDGRQIIAPSPLGLNLDIGMLGPGAQLAEHTRASVDELYHIVAGKAAVAPDRYNQLDLAMVAGGPQLRFNVIVRAYDNGVALRYAVPRQTGVANFKVMSEATQFNFERDYRCWGANMGRFDSSFEAEYDPTASSKIRNFHNYMAPLVCKTGHGQTTFAIAEADVTNYPGMYLSGRGDGGVGVAVTLPPRFDNDRNFRFKKTVAANIALADGAFQSPWRVIMLGDTPGELAASSLIPTLAAPSRIADTSWIKPSKTSWDWFNDWAVDVPHAGVNTATYKAFVDFSKQMKLDDIMIDEGWSVGSDVEATTGADITRARPGLDMPGVLGYAKDQGIGVWLWVQWQQLDNQMDAAMQQYQQWGIRGIKVDFMNRNDQEMVNWYHKVLERAAAHQLLVDLHGAYPPNGLNRTWPNFITQEGVLGAENNKWSARITATHNVTLPFTRMILGPMDYTPSGFVNASPSTFQHRNHEPMAMTTRGHGLAMYVVYDSPLQMVADGPRAYRSADGHWSDGAQFVQQVPTSWDETRVLAGDIGEFIVTARRKGDTWYLGAMTNEQARTLQVPLDFLGKGRFGGHVMQDGADASHLIESEHQLLAGQKLTLRLAPSGGAVAVIRPAGR